MKDNIDEQGKLPSREEWNKEGKNERGKQKEPESPQQKNYGLTASERLELEEIKEVAPQLFPPIARKEGRTDLNKVIGIGVDSSSSEELKYPPVVIDDREPRGGEGVFQPLDRCPAYFGKAKRENGPCTKVPSRAELEWNVAVHTYEDAVKWHLKWTPWFNKDMIEAIVKYAYFPPACEVIRST